MLLKSGISLHVCFNTVICQEDEFACVAENRCIPQSYVCDGLPDCEVLAFQEADEMNCPGGTSLSCA